MNKHKDDKVSLKTLKEFRKGLRELNKSKKKYPWMNERSVEQKRAFISILACNSMWYKSDYVYQYCSNALIHISVDYLTLTKEEANMLVSVIGIDDVDQSNFLVNFEDTNDLYEMLLDLFVQLLMEREYDVRLRSMILKTIKQFSLSLEKYYISENYLVSILLDGYLKTLNSKNQKSKKKNWKKWAMIGGGAVVGGTLAVLTGGLIVPALGGLATAIGVLGGATAAAIAAVLSGFLSTTAGIAVVTTLFGVGAAGLSGQHMNHRFDDVKEFEIKNIGNEEGHLCINLCISGWISKENEYMYNWGYKSWWKELYNESDHYCLIWESKELKSLGNVMDNLIVSTAGTIVATEVIKKTILNGIMSAITLPLTLMNVASLIDNPWSVALQRSENSGNLLAELIKSDEYGKRPINLIGYSLGSRLIYKCLMNLIEDEEYKNKNHIIENVILMGSAITINKKEWENIRELIPGKIINIYSSNDWILGYLYRANKVAIEISGLKPIEVEGIINVDVSEIIEGHTDYPHKIEEIMRYLREKEIF